MGQHALLSPSSALRWLRCPGSVNLCRDIPNTTSEYAEEGTFAHAVAAADLMKKERPGPIDRESHDYLKTYTDAIIRASDGKMLFVEQSVDISVLTEEPNARGTVDALIIDTAANMIEVHDLKFGQGHVVYAEQNEQLMIYGLAALRVVEDLFGSRIDNIKLVIHQPRRDHVSEWTVNRERLLNFGEVVAVTAQGILTGSLTELNPSAEACLWCAAKATCPALAAKVQAEVFDDFGTTEPPKTKSLNGELPAPGILEMIEEWVSAVKEKIHDNLKNRIAVPGWKLVLGREGNRAWSSEEAVAERLKVLHIKKAEAYTEELKSVAQLEKSIPKKKFAKLEDLISRSPAKPVLAAASDPKPEYQVATADDFEVTGELSDFDIFK